MNPEQIRALVLQVLTDANLASETFIANDSYMSTAFRSNEEAAQAAVEALTANGMLPTGCAERGGDEIENFQGKITRRIPKQRRYFTEWQEVTE